MTFYTERQGLWNKNFKISLSDLKEYFIQTYIYFLKKDYFEIAFRGLYKNNKLVLAPTMKPSPEIYLLKHLHNNKVYPIDEHYNRYSKGDLFSVIEILYEHIGKIDSDALSPYEYDDLIKDEAQKEFREHINSFLRFYEDGYFLDNKGHVIVLPNDGLLDLIQKECPKNITDNIVEKIRSAIKMYFSFSSTLVEKQKAIAVLADVMEPLREDMKEIFNSEWNFNKNKHDKLIFNIVNNFEIRHEDKPNKNQNKEYDKSIWYEWMFHYYLSTIYAYYRLKQTYTES
ncbi:hypothetical protein [Clostridium brassicae]|uniref:Uncharacterized protein n=1 Tax=Clostridium brassicae TaxID=2999072 RepID=A0ABT4D9A5_9CLOT|nr:hypothetical protein [Clostridium brassicae]MCY6958885.1 hypothetical protein [Clostridium brassicae]